MPFQFACTYAFLTYSQVGDASRDALFDFLESRFTFVYLCVSEEPHADGGRHFHVFARFATRFRSRDQSVFDFMGLHPNIKSAYAPKSCLDYVKKHGNYKESGTFGEVEQFTKKKTWSDATSCVTKREFMDFVAEHFPRDHVLNLERIEYFAEKKFKPEVPPYVPSYQDFLVPHPVREWIVNLDVVCFFSYRPRCASALPPPPPLPGELSFQ